MEKIYTIDDKTLLRILCSEGRRKKNVVPDPSLPVSVNPNYIL